MCSTLVLPVPIELIMLIFQFRLFSTSAEFITISNRYGQSTGLITRENPDSLSSLGNFAILVGGFLRGIFFTHLVNKTFHRQLDNNDLLKANQKLGLSRAILRSSYIV